MGDHINKDGLFQSDKYEECLKRDGHPTPPRAAPAGDLAFGISLVRTLASQHRSAADTFRGFVFHSDAITHRDTASALDAVADAAERPADEVTLSAAAADVLAERKRQVEAEGWTIEHDDRHPDGELAVAAACYAAHERLSDFALVREIFPWRDEWWKPSDRRRDLVKAAALIIAEIERLDRAALAPLGGE
jgi:hypothetical protein